jgi:hypothetical protein
MAQQTPHTPREKRKLVLRRESIKELVAQDARLMDSSLYTCPIPTSCSCRDDEPSR